MALDRKGNALVAEVAEVAAGCDAARSVSVCTAPAAALEHLSTPNPLVAAVDRHLALDASAVPAAALPNPLVAAVDVRVAVDGVRVAIGGRE